MALTGLSRSILILVVLISKCYTSDGEKACSCYAFQNRETKRFTWPEAREWCESNNKSLVVMETIKEWEFINSRLKDQIGSYENEWHIGLLKNQTTGNWSWINGRPLTFNKWQPRKPEQDDLYVLIAKEYPRGSFGSFNSINRVPRRGWICEEETDKCQGICMHHYPTSATTTTTVTTNMQNSETPKTKQNSETTVTMKTKPVYSFIPYRIDSSIIFINNNNYIWSCLDSTTLSIVSDVRRTTVYKKENTNSMLVTIIAAVLGAVLFVLILLLVVVVLRKRKKRLEKDPENSPASSSKQPEHQYESLPDVEATKLMGVPQDGKDSPQVECEYAVVNKLKKKPRKDELVYAELADFGDTNNDKETRKPEHQETTLYADVVTSDVCHKANADASDPAYANVESVK
ncbi:uncharacterized protein LOC114975098 [Acropora millepora]|uniref:uncharacterized protein LOC114975098 n=1 Tax=Acropora millepora TaxID=45264 RepID=UPI001CF5AE49|nr:uncharacterized protein LOC114975098 [Acropora millepora]